MESLKNVISLNQAAKISGYTQDYLGYLIRKGEIKGVKKGQAWFTTIENVKDYTFKKKIRKEEFAVREFFSPTRIKNIVIVTIIVFVGGFLYLSFFSSATSNLFFATSIPRFATTVSIAFYLVTQKK